MYKNIAEQGLKPVWVRVEFKPQTWHVEIRCPDPGHNHDGILGAFVSRGVAEEARDEWNANTNKLGFPGEAIICLCDCENRECRYV
jgi:hypothetical protein